MKLFGAKRLLFLIGLIFLINPKVATTQVLSTDNLSIYAGAEYSYMVITPERRNFNAINIQPHLQISYSLFNWKKMEFLIYSGYSQLGGKEKYTVHRDLYSASYRETISIESISFGVKGLWEYNSFKIGTLVDVSRLFQLKYTKFVQDKRNNIGNDRNTYTSENMSDFYAESVSNYNFNAGLSLQYDTRLPILIGVEGRFGLKDIFDEKKLPTDVLLPNIKWHLNSIRLMLGYAF